MAYVGCAGLRHVSVPITHRRTQVLSGSNRSNCSVVSGHGSNSMSCPVRYLNVFSATQEGAPMFAETLIGQSDSRPFNTARLQLQNTDNNIDLNLRVSNLMFKFYRWTRSRRFHGDIDLNSFDSHASTSADSTGDCSSCTLCEVSSPWDLGYSWNSCDAKDANLLDTINYVPDEEMYVIKIPQLIFLGTCSFLLLC